MRRLLPLIAIIALFALPPAAQGASVTPTLVDSVNNPGCDDIPNADPDWIEYKPFNTTPAGSYGPVSDGTLEVEFDVNAKDPNDPDSFQTVDWTSNIGVDAVIIKATDAGNAYVYDPPGPESLGDNGLQAPNANSGKPADVSHVTFCYDHPDPVITPDPDPDPPTVTTEDPPPTVTQDPPVTAVAPVTVAPPPIQQVAAQR